MALHFPHLFGGENNYLCKDEKYKIIYQIKGGKIMENRIVVSVIVPAYNAEKVVENCIGSILKQNLKNIEVIVVDDGSKDATRRVLEKLAVDDSRVRLIKKDKNEGLSAARNSALEIAMGEYVGFVDEYEWVE